MSVVNIIPETVPYYVWDSILKIKYYPKDEALKSIWTEEYVNNIEHYDESDMVCILKQIIDAVYSEKQKANLFERFINNFFGRWDSKDITPEIMCEFLYEEIQLLEVRGSKSKELNSPTFDLYQIKKEDKIYTIKEYDELIGR